MITPLQYRALATLPFSKEQVEGLYKRANQFGGPARRYIRELCASHERLRAELEAMQELLAEQKPGVK
jgi:hypothetical protein